MAEYYIDEFQSYLESLCTKHKDVQHGVGGRRGFARFHSDEEMNQIALNAGKNIVVVSHFFGRAIGAVDEQALRQSVEIIFACHAVAQTTPAINDAVAKAYRIMFDFVSRMRVDAKDPDYCPALDGLDLAGVSWDPVEPQPFLEAHYGWVLSLSFTGYQPSYDPSQWTA